MESSPRLSLAYLSPQQAQKHVTVNEALRRLDALVSLAVRSRSLAAQPATPAEGDAYILPAAPSGAAWGAFAPGDIAAFQDGAWANIAPVEGLRAFVIDEALLFVFTAGAWNSIGGGAGNPVTFGVNATPDVTNRLAVKSNAVLFSHDDVTPGSGDMRHAINKSAAAKTASHIFQSGFSGRAELGLIGDDNFRLKFSADGASWHDAFTGYAATGQIEFKTHTGIGIAPPGDFWNTAVPSLFMPYGYFGTNGSFGLGLWWNGYRNNGGGWTSLAINGFSHGAGLELGSSGLNLRWENPVAASIPVIRLQVQSTNVSPGLDNALSCGTASLRWSQVYAASGTINTSDARDKELAGALDDAETRVAQRLLSAIGKFRWKDAIARKGGGARLHIGLTAQAVHEAFAAEGLDAARYGVWCEDEIFQTIDDPEKGVDLRPTGETRQGLRYDQLMTFLIAALASSLAGKGGAPR